MNQGRSFAMDVYTNWCLNRKPEWHVDEGGRKHPVLHIDIQRQAKQEYLT